MATDHSLSMVTNSCIKQPVNPDTGLRTSLHERTLSGERVGSRNVETWVQNDSENRRRQKSKSKDKQEKFNMHIETQDQMIQDIATELGDLDDDNFYERLVQLKNDHKKTLSLCEELYNEKVNGHHNDSNEENYDPTYSTTSFDRHLSGSLNHGVRDSVRDMSASKPPRPPSAHSRPKSRSGVRSSKEAWLNSSQEYDSGSDIPLHESFRSEQSYLSDRYVPSAMARIDDMWENFSVEDYAPRERQAKPKQRRNSVTSSTSSTHSRRKEDAGRESLTDTSRWRHRITIPEPFKMTVRDVQKSKSKSKSVQEFEKEREEKERLEEEECQKKFKAQPVPANVYVPMYDELQEKQESRRQFIREMSQEILLSTQKPFKFSKREDDKKRIRQRTSSAPYAIQDTNKKTSKEFKAKPAPSAILDDSITERIQEEEEYRKIRVKMRAEEMLRASKLPPNMEARSKEITVGKLRKKLYAERAKKAHMTTEHKFRPKINPDIPDFEEQHRRMQYDIAYQKQQKEATVCKPFKLRTSQIPSKKDKIYEDMMRDEETLRENRWPYQNPRARPSTSQEWSPASMMSTSLDSIPAKFTHTAELRASHSKGILKKTVDKEIEELERERKRRHKEAKLRRQVAEKAIANDTTVPRKQQSKEKLRAFREAERARQEEYRQQLNEMKERVDSQPLLFERQSQVNARKVAERKYQETLLNAGIDEDFIRRKGSGVDSADFPLSDDDADNASDKEQSYTANYDDDYDDGLSENDKTPRPGEIDDYTDESDG
ncbi:unnamed protein product [Owenia fusiformis]|uniref:Uncharacterized protein n=1 Tax=Owenia fusiformis TaxID=6347 RepID=A0A8S4PFL0_OWEFU|nr:unnamed protein product [Owenia fusiformis]